MNIPYRDFYNDDSYLRPEKLRNIGRKKRPSKNNRRSDMAESWKYDWEAKERDKNHHERFCRAVRHADGLNERFAIVKFPFAPYRSALQQCYHVGRDRRIEPVAAIEFLRYSRARDRLRNS